jgi:hypothetical protein
VLGELVVADFESARNDGEVLAFDEAKQTQLVEERNDGRMLPSQRDIGAETISARPACCASVVSGGASALASEVSKKRRRSMPRWWGGRRVRSSS